MIWLLMAVIPTAAVMLTVAWLTENLLVNVKNREMSCMSITVNVVSHITQHLVFHWDWIMTIPSGDGKFNLLPCSWYLSTHYINPFPMENICFSFTLMPDNFTRQGKTSGREGVKELSP